MAAQFTYAGFGAVSAKEKVFKGNKIVTEKNKEYKCMLNGKEMTIKYKVAAKLRHLEEEVSYGFKYAAEKAVCEILSPEEVNAKAEKEYGEKYYNTDAFMFAEPELNREKLEEMSEEEAVERYACFVAFCNAVAVDEILELVANLAPKKKNGTFYENRVLRIGAYMGVDWTCEIPVLVAKAKSDTELEITVEKRQFDEAEYEFIRKNEITAAIAKNNGKPEVDVCYENLHDDVVKPVETIEEESQEEKEERARKAAEWLEDYGEDIENNPTILFNGKLFVFSGLAGHEEEKEHPIVQKVIEKGGEFRSRVSGRTDYLVVDPARAGYTKVEKALDLIEDGKKIKIVLLEDLKKTLEEKR